jgi:hypothetical protein
LWTIVVTKGSQPSSFENLTEVWLGEPLPCVLQSVTVGGSATVAGSLNVGGTIYAGDIWSQTGIVRLVGNDTQLDLWNVCWIQQNSGNMTITTRSTLAFSTNSITVGGRITASNGISTTTISSGSITATNFYGNGSFLTGISGGGGGSSNLVISNVTGTALLQTGTSPLITSTASGTYYILTNSGFSNIYIFDYLSSGTFNGYYTVLANQTGTSLTVATTNLNITRSGFLDIPPDTTMTLAYSPSNGYAGYIIL